MMRNATQRINDITSNLLNTYKNLGSKKQAPQELPLFVFLSRLFEEKQLQYSQHGVQFKLEVAPDAYFVFSLFNLSELQRILSNLINNAVEAIVKDGLITIHLSQENDYLLISIQDNGKGMPKVVLDKLGEMGMSYDKAQGTGIGLAHAIETVKQQGGEISFDSKLGKGTRVILKLPKTTMRSWFADKLVLQSDSIILIIDDDSSIHYLWDKKFAELGIKNPIHHFHFTHEVEQWLANNSGKINSVVLLSDNELIGSESNGLQLVERYNAQIQSSILVTSYYAFHELAPELTRINTKILPKELVMQLKVIS